MTIPNLILGLLISTLYGALFHLWRGGGPGRLLLYLVFSWIGFWVGQVVGSLLAIEFFRLGPLYLGAASLGSFTVLALGFWLSLTQPDETG